MNDEKYLDFFEEIKKFKDKQKEQKKRGLNDYNMVNIVRNETEEVGMHSNIIYSLLNPKGLHYQEELFLNIFIEKVLGFKIEDFGTVLSVEAEESTSKNRRIDFTLKSSNYYIGIEMKINAYDLEEQISHYFSDLQNKAQNDLKQEVIIYYLTLDGRESPKYSHNDISYRKVSFTKHILSWINSCQHEVKNITNLNEAFENYKEIVKKITNKYEGKVMPLKKFLLENDNLKLAMELEDSIKESKVEVQYLFWKELQNQLDYKGYKFDFTDSESNLLEDSKNRVKEYYDKNNRYFGLTKKIFDIDEKHSLIFYIEVDWNIIYGYCITQNNKRKDICNQSEFNEISKKITSLETIKWNLRSAWWIGWTYPKKRLDFRSFKDDIIFDLIDKRKRVQIVENLVEEIISIIKEVNFDSI